MKGPNVTKLICHKMSVDAIPSGGGFGDGIKFLMNPDRVVSTAKSATEWVNQAIGLIRTAADQNPWKNADDEAIAGELLSQIKAKQQFNRKAKT